MKTQTSLSVIGAPEPEEQPFWRSVTDEDVRNAISGSYLDTIYRALETNYTPRAPLPLLLIRLHL